MCKRQIERQPTTPTPANDNEPKPAVNLMALRAPYPRSGILSVVLERTKRVRLDFLADGVLTIRGERPSARGLSALY